MSDGQNTRSRRSVLKASSLTLTVPLIGGVASARSDQSRGRGETRRALNNGKPPKQAQTSVAFEDGQLKTDISAQKAETVTATSEQSEGIDEIPDEATPIPVDVLLQTVEDFNEAIEKGEVEIVEEDRGHVAMPAKASNARKQSHVEARGKANRSPRREGGR